MSNETMTPKEVYNAIKEEVANIEAEMTPLEIEAELIKEQQKPKDPVEAAAMGFNLYSFKFKQGVDHLSSRGAKRLLKAIIDGKLAGKKYTLNKEEEMMLEVGTFCLECRFLMELETYNNARELLTKAADPNQELTEEEKQMLDTVKEGEVSNG